jgi:hypothetical protein
MHRRSLPEVRPMNVPDGTGAWKSEPFKVAMMGLDA